MALNSRFRQLLDSLLEEYENLNSTIDGLQQENAKLSQQRWYDCFDHSRVKLEQREYALPLPHGDTLLIQTPRLSESPKHSETVFRDLAEVLHPSTPSRVHVMQNEGKPTEGDRSVMRVSENLNRTSLTTTVSRIGEKQESGLSSCQTELVRSVAAQRLRARFGKLIENNAWISAPILLETIKSLGLVSVEDLNELIILLVDLSNTCTQEGVLASIQLGLGISKIQSVKRHNCCTGWFQCCKKRMRLVSERSFQTARSAFWSGSLHSMRESFDDDRWKRIYFDEFIQIMLCPDIMPRAYQVDPVIAMYLETIKEVLLSGESNRLVAELTNVRIDDLASPPPDKRYIGSFEPVVYIMILANAIAVGFQTNSNQENWVGWTCIEIVFAMFFAVELAIRLLSTGISRYFCAKTTCGTCLTQPLCCSQSLM